MASSRPIELSRFDTPIPCAFDNASDPDSGTNFIKRQVGVKSLSKCHLSRR
jgi:hypothetical protein